MDKYKAGDRFLVRIDETIHDRNGNGEFTDYILNAEPSEDREEIHPMDGVVVQEKFLDQCSIFGVITDSELIQTDEMLPCPFCGCSMKLKKQTMADGRTIRHVPYGNHKRGCQLQFSEAMFVGNPTTMKGAIDKWNRREK